MGLGDYRCGDYRGGQAVAQILFVKQEVSAGAMGDGTNPALKEQLKGTPGMEQGYRFKQFHILKKMFQSAHFWLFTKLSFQCDTSAMSHHPQLPLYSQKNVDVSTAMASDLRWIQLLCEEAHSNTLSRSSELHKLCKRQDQEQTPS